MKYLKSLTIIMSSLFLACSSSLSQPTPEWQSVPLNDANIHVLGANYVNRTPEKLSFCRFSESCLNAPISERMFSVDKAMGNSGIKIQFVTKAENIKLGFSPREGDNRGADFAILQNNRMSDTFSFNKKQCTEGMTLYIENKHPGKETLFEIVMPSWANVALTQLLLNKEKGLVAFVPKDKSIYLAIGNSITHGVGQKSASYLTYPYLLAQKLNMNYYNLAVGGAKVSPAIAVQTAEMPQADLITILIGYNDMAGNSKTVDQYIKDYRSYLSEIRKNQPEANIYCISITYTKFVKNEKTGHTPDDFRKALEDLITDFVSHGDDKLYFIPGDSISSEANLRVEQPNDKVHFGIDGARMFSEELFRIINQ